MCVWVRGGRGLYLCARVRVCFLHGLLCVYDSAQVVANHIHSYIAAKKFATVTSSPENIWLHIENNAKVEYEFIVPYVQLI